MSYQNQFRGTFIKGPLEHTLIAAAEIAREVPVKVFVMQSTPLEIAVEASRRTRPNNVELVVLSTEELPHVLIQNIGAVIDLSQVDA